MRRLLALFALLLPALASAQVANIDPNFGYQDVLNVVAGTTSQNSADLTLPAGKTGMIIRLEYTAGATPSLDVMVQAKWPSDAEYETAVQCGLAIAALGEYVCILTNSAVPSAGYYPSVTNRASFIVPLPRTFRIRTLHGGGSQQTYHVDVLFF